MDKCYIIILWDSGIPHFYQTNEKVQWAFSALVKAYVRLGSAINAAKRLGRKYRYDKIRIYHINYSQSFSSANFLKGEFDKNIVFEIKKTD